MNEEENEEENEELPADGPLQWKNVRVDGWKGIAFCVVSDTHQATVEAVMVGDDKRHEVDRDDCTLLTDEEFCNECGQIGCRHDGRD